MATLNKTISGVYSDGKEMKSTKVVIRLIREKDKLNLSLSTYEGVMIAVPLEEVNKQMEQIQNDLIKALGE